MLKIIRARHVMIYDDYDDLSDVDIDIDEIMDIDNDNIHDKPIEVIDTDSIDEEIVEINDSIDEEIVEINDSIDEKIIEIRDNDNDNDSIDEEIIEIKDNDNDSIDEKIVEINDSIDEEIIEIRDNDNDNDESIEVIDKERLIHIDMIDNQISQVNKFSLVTKMYAKNTRKIGKLMTELQEGNIYDDDPWLQRNALQKINILIDEAFDNAWKMIQDKDRKMHKKIDINKYLETDRYVDKYTDIINGKIELLNNIGGILDSAMIEIQSKVDMINDVKQKENIDIETLELIHKTLDEIFKKWVSIASKAFENDIFSKYDMKPNKPDTKKGNTRSKSDKPDKPDKPDTKKRNSRSKPDTKKRNTRNKPFKPDKTDKANTKPDAKKDTKPNNYVILKNIGRF